MPNICSGFMNVRGYAPYVDEFVAILQARYSYISIDSNEWKPDPKNFTHIPHFFRVFQAIPFEEVWHSGVYKTVSIDIECAWSVYSCMFPGEHTYYNDFQINHLGQHFGSNILIESKRLQLEIEIWAQESGFSFQEHYKICSGILVRDECINYDYLRLDDYSNYEEYVKDSSIRPISEQEFNSRMKNEDYIIDTSVEEEVDFLPGDEPIYLAHLIMVK